MSIEHLAISTRAMVVRLTYNISTLPAGSIYQRNTRHYNCPATRAAQ